MNLLARVIVLAIIFIAILFAINYAKISLTPSSQSITKEHAEALITSDLQAAYPDALVNITNDTPSTYAGSWHITASVTRNATSPCPTYFVNTYDYPKFQFVSTPQNTYTANCTTYVSSPNNFKLGSAPVAVAWASKHVPSVVSYLSHFGINSTNSTSHFMNNATSGGVWWIKYSSRFATYSVYADLSDTNGTLLNTYNSSLG